jgi:hypothetical protein
VSVAVPTLHVVARVIDAESRDHATARSAASPRAITSRPSPTPAGDGHRRLCLPHRRLLDAHLWQLATTAPRRWPSRSCGPPAVAAMAISHLTAMAIIQPAPQHRGVRRLEGQRAD